MGLVRIGCQVINTDRLTATVDLGGQRGELRCWFGGEDTLRTFTGHDATALRRYLDATAVPVLEPAADDTDGELEVEADNLPDDDAPAAVTAEPVLTPARAARELAQAQDRLALVTRAIEEAEQRWSECQAEALRLDLFGIVGRIVEATAPHPWREREWRDPDVALRLTLWDERGRRSVQVTEEGTLVFEAERFGDAEPVTAVYRKGQWVERLRWLADHLNLLAQREEAGRLQTQANELHERLTAIMDRFTYRPED